MGLWIESHANLRAHPKASKLARRLGVTVPAAIGHLHCLWWWALEYVDDGNLAGQDADDIASAGMWAGDPEAFVRALVECRFLDPELTIHDWEDYAGKLLARRRDDAARKQAKRDAQKTSARRPQDVRKTSGGHPQDVRSESAPTVPYRTETVPNLDQGAKAPVEQPADCVDGQPDAPAAPAKPDKPKSKLEQDVDEVLRFWAETMGKPGVSVTEATAGGKKRRSIVRSRLREPCYGVDKLKAAIRGCRASPHHMGANDRGKVYNDITLICRPEKIDGFIEDGSESSPSGPRPAQVRNRPPNGNRAARLDNAGIGAARQPPSVGELVAAAIAKYPYLRDDHDELAAYLEQHYKVPTGETMAAVREQRP